MADIGRLAERTLQKWCAQAEVTINPSDEDEHGWDFKLEFPDQLCPRDETPSLDEKSAAPRCLVQVKGIEGQAERKSLKLSNWTDLVLHPLPAFYLILRFNEQDQCEEAYLVHIWREEIEGVLRRLRKLEAEGETDRINKKYRDLRWSEDDRLDAPDSEEFVSSVCEAVGPDLDSYVDEKIGMRKSLGFEGPAAQLNVTFTVPEEYRDRPEEALVDFELGLVPSVDVVSGELTELRFGIGLPEEEFSGGELEVRNTEPGWSGRLRFRLEDRSDEVVLPADAYAPSAEVVDMVPSEYAKLRFQVPYCEIISQIEGDARFNFRLPEYDEPKPLAELRRVASLIQFLDRAEQSSDETPIEIMLDDRQYAKFTSDAALPSDLVRWADIVKDTSVVAKYFDIEQYSQVRTGELFQQEQVLDLASTALTPGRPQTRFRFPSEEEYSSDTRFCFPAYADMVVGERRLFVSFAFTGHEIKTETDDEETFHHIRSQEAIVTEELALDRNEDLPKRPEEYMLATAEDYADDHIVIAWWRSPERERANEET